jgi:hypothetical protein
LLRDVRALERMLAESRVLLTREVTEDSLDVLDSGGVPELQALSLHNGTVYRWNRPCYGITDGVPHLRIECRVIASGPTIADEVANAAFWIGQSSRNAPELILAEALPLARVGLADAGVDPGDIDEYLGIIRDRRESGSSGARWIVRYLLGMRDHGTRSERLAAVTAGAITREKSGVPCHRWDDATIGEAGGWRLNYESIEQMMTIGRCCG